ncbi:hypothetical protein N0Q91_07335 [Sinorhizobium sp. K101]|nr:MULTISPECIES: hypothetical protein [unclassified Sinorhizobium]WEJ09053.1 hypothetical protein N0Q90_12975 [Sinorhizobium sp. M103]WEJ16406.1 hypothetical protein N0Q91_07335 [Sinorhizobium sp. K101]
MIRAETYAVVNLAALNLIEAVSAAYFVTESQAIARHEFRAREMLKKIAFTLGYDLAEAAAQDDRPQRRAGAEFAAGTTGSQACVRRACGTER